MLKSKFYDYYAFVCHRSADKPLALAIQKKLERYSIPRKIIEENNYPSKQIRHICVDVTEFEDSNLYSDILNCLEKSDKLIVICSESGASPVNGDTEWKNEEYIDWRLEPVSTGWVGFEILNFINIGRKKSGLEPFSSIDEIKRYLNANVEKFSDAEYVKEHPEINPFRNIIPVVKNGDPINRTCFHPIIKIAIDRGLLKWYEAKDWGLKTEITSLKHGERGKFIDLILAVLSPKDAEEFRRRDKIRSRIKIAVTVTVIAFFAAFITFIIDYRMPHISCFSDYVLVRELPQGIGKLSGREIKKQPEYYIITTTKYNRTIKLEHVNPIGTPATDDKVNQIDAPMIAVYRCRENWQPDVCEYQDRNGIVQMTYAYATDLGYVTFQENNFVSNQVYPISKYNEFGIADRLKIDRYGLVHDQEGRLTEKKYMSGVNFVYDEKGIAGEKYEYDIEGRLISIHYINRAGDYINNQNGVHGLIFSYDRSGFLSGYSYINKDGEYVFCEDGYSGVEIEKVNGMITRNYLDMEGNLINNDHGYAKEIQILDGKMLTSEKMYFGKDGDPAYTDGSYHKAVYAYNDKGDVIDISLLNDKGNLIIGKDGYARKIMTRDENGNILKEEYLGSGGIEILLDNKACSVEREYSDKGFLLSESFYGLGGRPVYTSEGYHSYINEYDSKNRLISTEYFGFDNKKVNIKPLFHKTVFEYDDRGNMTKISLYNTSDRLVPYSGYWARKLLAYNGGGQVTRVEYLNQFEKQVNVVGGYAVIENVYEDNGLLKETAYYDNKGMLCDDSYINSYGVLVGKRYFARIAFTYDDFGNPVRTDYFDTDNKPVSNYYFSSKECVYDETGHKILERYLDENGNPPKGYFSHITYGYDDYGAVVEAAFWGENNVPLETRAVSGQNAHLIKQKRDPRGLVLNRTAYDKSGGQAEEVRYFYDDNGRQVLEEYLNNNELTENEEGYAVKKQEYNAFGRQTKEAYYDSEGKLCKIGAGYSVRIQKYNNDGAVTDIYYYDEKEMPVNTISGYSHIHEDLDAHRNTTNCEFRDKNDDIIVSYKVEYNDNAQIIKESLYGPDGKFYSNPESGVASRSLEYDDRGNQIGEEYYTADETPFFVLDEFAGWKSEYNEDSLETRRTYLGTDGSPVKISQGFSSVRFIYDEYGREIERIFFDEKGDPVNTKFGFASYKVQYDESGEVNKYFFFDKDDSVCDAEGEVKRVELNLVENVDFLNGDLGINAVAETVYNIYRVTYQNTDGEYDLMLQPRSPLSPAYQIADYIEDIKVKYKRISGNSTSEGDAVNAADDDLLKCLSEYTGAIEEGNADQLWDFLLMDGVTAAVSLLEKQLGVKIREEELKEFYYGFYCNELTLFKRHLEEDYGEFAISYDIRDKTEYTGEVLEKVIEAYEQYGIKNLEGIVALNVAFTVSGKNRENIVTDGFLYPNLMFARVAGRWKLLTPDGFPKPDTEKLKAFLGTDH